MVRLRYSVWPGDPVSLPKVWRPTDVRWATGDWLTYTGTPDEGGQVFENVAAGEWLTYTTQSGVIEPAPQDWHLFELADVNLDDPSSVLDFCRSVWLLPFHWSDNLSRDSGTPLDHVHALPYGEVRGPSVVHDHDGNLLVDAREVRLRVERLRWLIEQARAVSDGADVAPDFTYRLNPGLWPFTVHVTDHDLDDMPDGLKDHPSAYNVACLNIANDLAIRAPYRRCADETCRRIFVRQRGRAQYSSRLRGVRFCSDQHARNQAQREKRRRATTITEKGTQ